MWSEVFFKHTAVNINFFVLLINKIVLHIFYCFVKTSFSPDHKNTKWQLHPNDPDDNVEKSGWGSV